jgi:hypothetical protein
MVALATTLVSCSSQPQYQAATKSCTDERQFACLHRTAAHQPTELASLKTDPPKEPRLKSEKPRPLWVHDRAGYLSNKKPKPAITTAKNEHSATRIAPPPAPPRMQLEQKSSAAAAVSNTVGQPTVGLVPNSKSRTIQEQVAAAIAVAQRTTIAALAVARDDVEPTEGESPTKTDPLVAIVMARPEIKSVTDLAGKNIAMDERYSASSVDVFIAFVIAGAASVEVSSGHATAIDRLSNGEVTAAVLALVSADAAEAFPEFAGFNIFRVPLSPPALKARP